MPIRACNACIVHILVYINIHAFVFYKPLNLFLVEQCALEIVHLEWNTFLYLPKSLSWHPKYVMTLTKIRHDVKTKVFGRRHDVKKFVMMSKYFLNVRFDHKIIVWCDIKGMLWRHKLTLNLSIPISIANTIPIRLGRPSLAKNECVERWS